MRKYRSLPCARAIICICPGALSWTWSRIIRAFKMIKAPIIYGCVRVALLRRRNESEFRIIFQMIGYHYSRWLTNAIINLLKFSFYIFLSVKCQFGNNNLFTMKLKISRVLYEKFVYFNALKIFVLKSCIFMYRGILIFHRFLKLYNHFY